MLKTEDAINDMLYKDEGPYISAIPVLMYCALRERFYNFVSRLFS